MKKKKTLTFAVIAMAILFAGNEDLYAGGGVENPWGIVSPAPSGIKWTGNLVITGQIVSVPGLPGGLPLTQHLCLRKQGIWIQP